MRTRTVRVMAWTCPLRESSARWRSSTARSGLRFAAVSLLAADLDLPAVDPNAPGGIFSLSDPQKLTGMLNDAGYGNVRTEEMEFNLPFVDFDDYWSFILEFAGAAAVLVRNFPEDQQRTVRSETEKISEPYRSGDGYDFPGLTVNAVAR